MTFSRQTVQKCLRRWQRIALNLKSGNKILFQLIKKSYKLVKTGGNLRTSQMTMETDQTHQNHVYNIPDDVQGFIKPQNSAETKHVAPRSSSKRMYIILGVAMAVIVVAMVAVVVPVVVIGKLNSDSKNADKAKCGPYSYPGIDIFSLRPKITTDKQYCPMKGDCWTGEQCYACFKRQEWKVGNIKGMPVCCKNCEVTGLVISPSECRCLHNGHSSQNVQSRK